MKIIKLNHQKVTIVDDEDFDELNKFKWSAMKEGKTFYAKRIERDHLKTIYMSRLIMKAEEGDIVYHTKGDGLDNRKLNLRIVKKGTTND